MRRTVVAPASSPLLSYAPFLRLQIVEGENECDCPSLPHFLPSFLSSDSIERHRSGLASFLPSSLLWGWRGARASEQAQNLNFASRYDDISILKFGLFSGDQKRLVSVGVRPRNGRPRKRASLPSG